MYTAASPVQPLHLRFPRGLCAVICAAKQRIWIPLSALCTRKTDRKQYNAISFAAIQPARSSMNNDLHHRPTLLGRNNWPLKIRFLKKKKMCRHIRKNTVLVHDAIIYCLSSLNKHARVATSMLHINRTVSWTGLLEHETTTSHGKNLRINWLKLSTWAPKRRVLTTTYSAAVGRYECFKLPLYSGC